MSHPPKVIEQSRVPDRAVTSTNSLFIDNRLICHGIPDVSVLYDRDTITSYINDAGVTIYNTVTSVSASPLSAAISPGDRGDGLHTILEVNSHYPSVAGSSTGWTADMIFAPWPYYNRGIEWWLPFQITCDTDKLLTSMTGYVNTSDPNTYPRLY